MPNVMKSLIDMGHFTRNPSTDNWMSTANNANAAMKAIASDSDMTVPQKMASYLLDIEARTNRFMEEFGTRDNVHIWEVRFEHLLNEFGVKQLFWQLRIPFTADTHTVKIILQDLY